MVGKAPPCPTVSMYEEITNRLRVWLYLAYAGIQPRIQREGGVLREDELGGGDLLFGVRRLPLCYPLDRFDLANQEQGFLASEPTYKCWTRSILKNWRICNTLPERREEGGRG